MTAQDWTARALTAVDASATEMVQALARSVRCPSVGGSAEEHTLQHDVADQLAGWGVETDVWAIPLRELAAQPEFPGVEVDRSEAWGVVGRLPGNGDGPSLMLNGHVDVVPPGDLATWAESDPYSGQIRGDVLYGRGACDMKAGLVAALYAVRAVQTAGVPLRGDLLLASVQGEEDGGLGTYATLRRGWRAEGCVIPEPTGLDLVPANAGSLTFRLSVPGLATHAARRTAGVSALDKVWPLQAALADLEQRRNQDVDPMARRWDLAYPISIGTIRGGEWASTVPDLVVLEGRMGVMLDEPVELARQALEQAVAVACQRDPWLRDHPATVEWWGGVFESGRLDADSPLLPAMASAHALVSDRVPQTWAAPYGSDLRLMHNVGGVPTLHYGPGDVTLAHGPDERVPVSEVVTCARALAALIVSYCGPGSR